VKGEDGRRQAAFGCVQAGAAVFIEEDASSFGRRAAVFLY
jgi:hypothetical protein